MGRGKGERAFERSGSEGVRKGGTGQREKGKLKDRKYCSRPHGITDETIKMKRHTRQSKWKDVWAGGMGRLCNKLKLACRSC